MSGDSGVDGVDVRYDHTDKTVVVDFNQGFTTLVLTPTEARTLSYQLDQAVKKASLGQILGSPRG